MRHQENPDVVVGGAKQKHKRKPRSPRQSSNAKLVVGLAILLVVIVALAAWYFHNSASPKPVAHDACSQTSNPVLKEAVAAFQPGKQAMLKQVAQKITGTPDYQQDPNCMLVLVIYNLQNNNPRAAQGNLDQLKTVYDAKTGFSGTLGQHIDIANLQTAITQLQKAMTAAGAR